MNKKTKGIVAGAAGAALLLGAGGTFALWSDAEHVPGGTITAGTLDIKATETQWYDVSPDRQDAQDIGVPFQWDASWLPQDTQVWSGPASGAVYSEFQTLDTDGPSGGTTPVVGHPIELDSWRIVPGDFVLGQNDVHLRAEGDNLRAEVTVVNTGSDGSELAQALGLSFFVTDGGAPVSEARPIGEPVHVTIDGSGDRLLQVHVIGNFPSGVSGQDLMSNVDAGEVQAVLDGLEVRVAQVRG